MNSQKNYSEAYRFVMNRNDNLTCVQVCLLRLCDTLNIHNTPCTIPESTFHKGY